MTIKDFMYLSMDSDFETVSIYDCRTHEEVYQGMYSDCEDDFENYEICSWNLCFSNDGSPAICFNIELHA